MSTTEASRGVNPAVSGVLATPEPIVFVRDGDAFTNSQHVAAYFGKRHADMLRDIDVLIGHDANLRHVFFHELSEDHPTVSGRKIRSFDLTKDGFTLLVMGYTGPKAMPFKLAYIARFNAMEAELRARPMPAMPDFTDPKVLLGAFQHLQEQVATKDAVIADQKKGLIKLERLEGADGSMCITDAAKTLGVAPAKNLFARMQAERWIFKRPNNRSWLAYHDKLVAGLMEHDDHLFTDDQGRERVATRALVTAKGLVKLAEILSRPLH